MLLITQKTLKADVSQLTDYNPTISYTSLKSFILQNDARCQHSSSPSSLEVQKDFPSDVRM